TRAGKRFQETGIEETFGPTVKTAACAGVSVVIGGMAQVIGTVAIDRSIGKLALPCAERGVVISDTGRELAGGNQQFVPGPDHLGTPPVESRLHDDPCREFGLVNGRYRLGMPIHRRMAPIELWRIDGGQMNHGEPDVAALVKQFCPR